MSTHSTSSKNRKTLSITVLTLVGLLLFVLLAVPVAYLLRHSLAMMIGASALSPYGIELRSISGLQIGLHAITVENIQFAVVDQDTGTALQESSIADIRVTFAPNELLQGRVQSIETETVSLFGIPANNPTDEAKISSSEIRSGSDLNLEAIVTTLQGLPLNSISVDNFSMNPYFSNASIVMTRDQREVSVRVATSDFNFSIQTNWHDTAFVSSYFIADAALPDHDFPGDALTGAMRLYFREELAASVDFSLGETDNLLAMDGNGEIQLAVLAPFLQHHELLDEELAGVAGTLRFSALAQEHLSTGQPSTGEEQQLTFELLVSGDSHASGPIPSYPQDASATFLWSGGQPLQISGRYEPQDGRFSLNAKNQGINITLHSQGQERQLTLNLADFSAQCEQDGNCIVTQSSTLHVPLVISGTVMLEDFSAVTNAELTSINNAFTLRLDQGSRISAGTITSGTTTLEDVNLLVLETLTIGVSTDGDLQAQSSGAELTLPSILSGEINSSAVLKATDLLVHWPSEIDAQPEISAELQIRNLGSNLLPVVFRNPEIDATVALLNNSLQVNSHVRLADRDILQINATHSLADGTGEGTFAVPSLQFGEGDQSLSQLFFSMPYEADLISGALAASAQLRWYLDDTGRFLASGPISINADRISGFYEDVALLELSTTVTGELTDLQFSSDENLHMEVGSLDPGLPVENIAFDYTINTADTTLEIRDVQATMFNGTLGSTGLAYDWSAPENLFALALDNIDLSRVLAMGAYEGINATGLVSGALPVRIAGSNVSVHGGTLQVQAPGGSIRYQSATAGDSGNAALDLVNLALSNYQYDVMDAEVDYLPSGELILAVKLEGISPAVNEGQQINVNLNVTDNIPALLESLQASRNITDALQRELDER